MRLETSAECTQFEAVTRTAMRINDKMRAIACDQSHRRVVLLSNTKSANDIKISLWVDAAEIIQ